MRVIHNDMPPTGAQTPKYISLADAGTILGVHSRTVRRAVSRGEIQAFKFGTALRVRVADVDAWAAARAVPSATFRG